MCHLDDLSFGRDCERLPGVFTSVSGFHQSLSSPPSSQAFTPGLTPICLPQFRKIVERDVDVRPCVRDVERLEPLPASIASEAGELPSVKDLCPSPTDGEVSRKTVCHFRRHRILSPSLWATPPLKNFALLFHPSQLLDERSVLPFKGGETAGRARVDFYLWKSNLVATYKDTRNGLVGGMLQESATYLTCWVHMSRPANGSCRLHHS